MKNRFNLSQIFLTLILVSMISGCDQIQPSNPKSQTDSQQIPHLEKQGTATRLIVEGKPFLLISDELHNSTCGGFEFMRTVWKQMATKNLNSVIASVSWELVEPKPGKFDITRTGTGTGRLQD